jgi:ubiquinone/menaquinone biosynthesis C-methylase UbiE
MNLQTLKQHIEGIDIYILDQILKNRYQIEDKILDAGFGKGRNLKWFYNSRIEIYGIDIEVENVTFCKEIYRKQQNHFYRASLTKIPFEANIFNHIICNAVLHFAKDFNQFSKMFNELIRVLQPKGSLLIRMASEFGIKEKIKWIGNGLFELPDGSTRFLLTEEILFQLKCRTDINLVEDIKTTIVENKRSMTTLVIEKI